MAECGSAVARDAVTLIVDTVESRPDVVWTGVDGRADEGEENGGEGLVILVR